MTEVFKDPEEYLKRYNILKDKFTREMGSPIKEERVWKDNQYKDNPNKWGYAVK